MRARVITVVLLATALAIGAVPPSSAASPPIDTVVTAAGFGSGSGTGDCATWSFNGVSLGPEPAGAGVHYFYQNFCGRLSCSVSLTDLSGNSVAAVADGRFGTPPCAPMPYEGGAFAEEFLVTGATGIYAELVGHAARLTGSVTQMTTVSPPWPRPLDVILPPPYTAAVLTGQLSIA